MGLLRQEPAAFLVWFVLLCKRTADGAVSICVQRPRCLANYTWTEDDKALLDGHGLPGIVTASVQLQEATDVHWDALYNLELMADLAGDGVLYSTGLSIRDGGSAGR